ncbi:MAG TPA: FapA family protein [Bacillota bacterium]|nr:FapA family protein [Bacillota bacterium]
MSDYSNLKSPFRKEVKIITSVKQLLPRDPEPEEKSPKTEKEPQGKAPADKKNKPVAEVNEIDEKIAGIIGLKNFNDKKDKNAPAQTIKHGRCQVIASADYMEAYLLIEPPGNGGNWPLLEEAVDTIKEQGLSEFDLKVVEDAVEHHIVTQVLIAKGTPPIHGQDTDLNILYEIVDLHKFYIEGLIENEHHRVDYHEVKTINSVEKGTIVAEKVTATTGTDGVDVRGRVIPANPGKEKEIKLGKNVTWDETGTKIGATSPGKLLLINNCLNVLPVCEVEGNVNFHTGNIDFAGNIVIHGEVENGFKVRADGDVIIMGNVDSADIMAGGKLSIKGGVFGMDKSRIECGGDFYAKEIERASLNCRGTVTIKDAIMHCQVIAEYKVIVEGGKGWIVGGTIQAGEYIEANIIGSRLGTITELEVYPTYRHLVEGHDQSGADAIFGADSFEAQPQGKEYTTRGRIKFKETLYPGVRLKIGSFLFVLQDELNCATLYCTHNGELRLISSR